MSLAGNSSSHLLSKIVVLKRFYMCYIKVYSNAHDFTTICFLFKTFPNNRYTSLITIRFWHILMVDQRTKYAAPLWTCRTELLFWRQFPIIGVQILPGPQETHLLCTSVCENPVRIFRSLSVELGCTSVPGIGSEKHQHHFQVHSTSLEILWMYAQFRPI